MLEKILSKIAHREELEKAKRSSPPALRLAFDRELEDAIAKYRNTIPYHYLLLMESMFRAGWRGRSKYRETE